MSGKSNKASKSAVAEAVQAVVADINDSVARNARVKVNRDTITSYAEAMGEGDKFPPIRIVKDKDGVLWLADGFHRLEAARLEGWKTIDATIEPGTQRDAILVALTANATHGLQRTNADKRHAVLIVLNDPTWAKLSDRKLATLTATSQPFVSKVRAELSGADGNAQPGAAVRAAADNGAAAENDSDGGGESAESAPAGPFDEFNGKVKEIVGALRTQAKALEALLGYDAATKAFTSRFAVAYSPAGTVGQLKSIAAALTDGLPVGTNEDGSIRTAKQEKVEKRGPRAGKVETEPDAKGHKGKGHKASATEGDAAPDAIVAATEGQPAN